MTVINPDYFYNVIIIGSGPCGLAVASRLREPTPSALYSDYEHQRFHFLRNKGHLMNFTDRKARKACSNPIDPNSLLVLDAYSDQWLGMWDSQFDTCEIPTLRSPMFFHPDPADIDGLIAFANSQGRTDELVEIKNVVGKELSKHQQKKRSQKKNKSYCPIEVNQRNWKDYFRPSTKLFRDYCQEIINRYNLENVVKKGKCKMIERDTLLVGNETIDGFTITTEDGRTFGSRAVVVSCGPIGKPNYCPDCFPDGSCHTSHLFTRQVDFIPTETLNQRLSDATTVVVGGGLTSAQICDALIRRGAQKVILLCRGELKVKHFDFDLDWVSKFKNYRLAQFWFLESDAERWKMIQDARNGGSMNPELYRRVKHHSQAGKLDIMTHSTIGSKQWDEDRQQWTLSIDSHNGTAEPLTADYIYYATGSTPAAQDIPFLSSIIKNYPIEFEHGLPCLTDNLQWAPDLPLFITGRLASLRVGPASANLEGARAGAERVAWAIQQLTESQSKKEAQTSNHRSDLLRYAQGDLNLYEILAGSV